MWDGYKNCTVTYCVVVIKHVTFFTIWAKLTVAFTCTSLPLNLYTSVFGCGCGFGFEQKIWRIGCFGEKKPRIDGFAYPFSLPSFSYPDWSCRKFEDNEKPYFLLEIFRGSFSSYVWVSKFCESARQYKCLSECYRRKTYSSVNVSGWKLFDRNARSSALALNLTAKKKDI